MSNIKNASGCVDAGPHDGELQFHHTDPSTKMFKISDGYRHTKAKLEAELAKCVVLCSACHIRRHHG